MTRPIATAALFLLSVLAWAGLTVTDGPWAGDSAAVVAVDLVVLGSVAVVGILVASARWGRRLAIVVTTIELMLAAAVDIGAAWWPAVALTGVAMALLVGTGLEGVVRKRPNATGPPARAVVLALGLAGVPGIVAAARPGGLGTVDWIAVVGSAVVTVWYARALPAAPEMTRFGIPLIGVVALVGAGVPAGFAALAACAALTGLAWTADARVAARPLVERGRAVPIPPELAPPEILDAAGLDERGRRKDDR